MEGYTEGALPLGRPLGRTAYNQFNRWAKKGPWEDFFLSYEEKLTWSGLFADGSYICIHQHASGARIGEERAIGNSREDLRQSLIWPPMRIETRFIFEITGVRSTTHKLQTS